MGVSLGSLFSATPTSTLFFFFEGVVVLSGFWHGCRVEGSVWARVWGQSPNLSDENV